MPVVTTNIAANSALRFLNFNSAEASSSAWCFSRQPGLFDEAPAAEPDSAKVAEAR